MKKTISIILAIFIIFSYAAVITSCSLFKGDEDRPDGEIEYINITKDGAAKYRIVLDGDATDAARSAANTVVDAVNEATGVKLDRAVDDQSVEGELKEILIGKTNRTESEQVLSELSDIGWKIKVIGDKLVIAASNDHMLMRACQAFVAEVIIKDGNGVKVDKAIDRFYDGSNDMILLFDEEGSFKYKLVYSKTASQSVLDATNRLKELLRSLFNGDRSIKAGFDTSVSEYEILVGPTDRQQSRDMYAEMGVSDIKSKIVGNKILIGSASDLNLDVAVSDFYSNIAEMVRGTYNGKYAIPCDYLDENTSTDFLVDVPMLGIDNFVGEDDVGDGSHVFVWSDVELDRYEAYRSELENAMTKINDYEMDGNKYGLYSDENATVYLTYLTSRKQVRLFAEKAGNIYPDKAQAEYTAISDYKPILYMLDVDTEGADANGGMSFALKLADGSFVLIDGGYNTDAEGDKIYNFLRENTPAGQIPVVSAWIITHQHGDHYGTLLNVTKRYINMINVKAFYCNMPNEGHECTGTVAGTILKAMKKWSGATIYDKVHSGMSFYVVDAMFECIFTHEDIYPDTGSNINDTSMVLRITHGGKKIMMLGDAEEVASIVMEKNWSAPFLRSDIVQYSHHGYEGCNINLYDMIAAPTVLWPITVNPNRFKTMVKNGGFNGAANYYIANEATYVKAIICADEAHFGPYAIDLLTYIPPEPVAFSDFSRSQVIYISNYVELNRKIKASLEVIE